MITEENIPTWAWKLTLATAAAIWGGSFVVLKNTLDVITPAWVIAIRFVLSAVIVGALFWKKIRPHLDAAHIKAGAILGLFYGTAFVVQNFGLDGTTPGRNAFLTATYSIMVPFLNWAVARRRPGAQNIVAALLAVVGVGLLSLGDDLSLALNVGDQLTLICAVLYAVHITLVPRFAASLDVMTITVVQLASAAVLSLVCALVLEPLPDPAVFADPAVWASLAYLVLLASCVCMVFQNLGQAHVPPAQAGLLLSLEGVFAVVASVIFYHEEVTPRLALGFALIFVAIVVSEVGPTLFARRREAAEGGAA